jgi:ubiquinone/menaquinone biosynthesis C-methylase UbiE
MQAKLQRRIQRYGWDKASRCYEPLWRQQIAPAQKSLLTAAGLRPGERVLDVACGTGLVTFAAAWAVEPTGAVVGTDLSEEMVNAARREAARRNALHVTFQHMDAEALEFADLSFDAVLSSLGLMYFPDPLCSLKEMRRVVKPGGRIVVAVWGARDRCGWAGIFPVVDARVETEVCPLFFSLGAKDTLRFTLKTADFTSVRTERLSTVLHYNSAEEACEAAFAGGPVALAYSRFDDKTRKEAHADYLASIEPYRDGSTYNIPGEFVIGFGRREATSG